MLWLVLISILIGCIMVPIIFIICGISRRPLESEESDGIQSELDHNALLRSHGYEVGEKIGEGAYADVRKAYSIANKKEVAIKIVNKREVKTNHNSVIHSYLSRDSMKHDLIICDTCHAKFAFDFMNAL